ncbi:hypothetical protein [Aquariibacter albus]|uniref:Uncharacterized protein n=1 Tax=Aquariibacter albus TaxID=2759899 RepID=A0A839HI09_9BURK|nr:hypothetical protein [Aquariibacter albus]MBB1161463.1 hypothetical protein [Aquariibacter albus]
MSVRVKHAFVSTKADGDDPSVVRPSDWNADHALLLAGPALVGRASDGDGAAAELHVASGLALDATAGLSAHSTRGRVLAATRNLQGF